MLKLSRTVFAASILPAFILLQGCAYTTHNALPPHLKTVAVPMFTNRTFIEDYTRKLEVEVTDSVRNAFIQAGELKLASREDADLILEGDIMKLQREVIRADRFGDPAEMRVIIRARISVYDVKEAKYLLKDNLVTNAEKNGESGNYSIRRGETEDWARKKAVEDIGRDIARRITERWPDPSKK